MLRCPRCGGSERRDLSRIRRGTGVGLTVGSLAALTALAVQTEVAVPGWVLPVVVGLLFIGVLAWTGAGRAQYCPRCNVRMERQPPRRPPPGAGS